MADLYRMPFRLCCVALLLFLVALPTAGHAMGNGPHPHLLYGIPVAPAREAPIDVPDAKTLPEQMTATSSAWDHPIYKIAAVMAGGEVLLGTLMLVGSKGRRDEET